MLKRPDVCSLLCWILFYGHGWSAGKIGILLEVGKTGVVRRLKASDPGHVIHDRPHERTLEPKADADTARHRDAVIAYLQHHGASPVGTIARGTWERGGRIPMSHFGGTAKLLAGLKNRKLAGRIWTGSEYLWRLT